MDSDIKCTIITREIIELERQLPTISRLELLPLIARWRKAHNRPKDIPSANELLEFRSATKKIKDKKIKGENISSKGSEFAKKLTNIGNNLEVEYRGKTFRNAEHAYQTWKSGDFDEDAYNSTAFKPVDKKKVNKNINYQIMVEIITSKLQQHPELIDGIKERGGLDYINNSTHNDIGDSYWETSGQNKFIQALADAYSNIIPSTSNITSNKKVTLSTSGYKKNDPQNNTTLDFVFTENAEAYIASTGIALNEMPNFPNQGRTKLNVSDVNGTNQAGIRTDIKGNISPNAYGIVVKKYQQDANGKFVHKEGQFQDTEEDFNLFIKLNEDMFDRLSKSKNTKVIFPTQMGLGKAALPRRFAEWLQNQLSERFGISSTIEKNQRADYDGYGLKLNSAPFIQEEETEEETIQTMSTQEYLDKLNKVATTFTTIEKLNRVNLINRLFINETQKLLNIEKENLKNRIQLARSEKEVRELSFALENIKEIDIFKKGKSPIDIFKDIKKTIDTVASYNDAQILKLGQQLTSNYFSPRYANAKTDSEKENIKKQWAMSAKIRGDRYRKAFQKMSKNFWALAEESTSTFSTTLGCIIDIKRNKVTEEVQDADNEPYTNDGIKSEYSDNKEEKVKDGWMVDTREVSTFSGLSNRVRKIIGNMPRMKVVKDNGTERMVYEEDDLGNVMYLNSNYVHSQLIQALVNMTTATDMIPMLEELAKKKPWVHYIISELKKDNKLFTAFYRNYRKDYLQYWIQKYKQNADGSIKIETIGINKSEGTSHYFDDWRDNYEFGNKLDEDSIYNSDGEFIKSNAEIGYNIVQSLSSEISRKERNEVIELSNNEDIIKNLSKVLSMLGISISKDVLVQSLNYQIENEIYNPPIVDILSSLYTIYSDMVKGNEKLREGQPVDFINVYGSQYNKIAEMFNFVEDDAVESSVRQGDKTRYAHVNPSYMTTLIKKLKNSSYEEFIMEEYGKVDWFRNQSTGEWYNEMIKDILEDENVRNKLTHVVVVESNKKEYNKWTQLDATLVLINQYFSEPTKEDVGYAFYQSPILSDSQSAEFIKYKRYIHNYKDIITTKFINVVKQEINRIDLVKRRFNSDNVDKIANFDIIKKKDGSIKHGGDEFKFFPELNTKKYDNGKSFLDKVAEFKNNKDEVKLNEFIKKEIESILDDRFNAAMVEWNDIGLLERLSDDKKARYKYFNKYSEDGVRELLEEWYYNSTYAQSQIIQVLTTDLAYYKNLEDFQKRAKQFHAPAERLNKYATWNGKPVLEVVNGKPRKERVIYLKDEIKTSNSFEDIKEIIEAHISDEAERAVILGKYNKYMGDGVNVTDAQAYRSLESFRATQIMADMWSDVEEEAYNNIINDTWSAKDFVVLWNTRKPYLYTQTNQSNQVDDGLIRVSTQHKNSEMILLTHAIFGTILGNKSKNSKGNKLAALSDFMRDYHIDVAMFNSSVKDGLQGVIDLNDVESYDEVYSKLVESTEVNTTENPNVVHEFDYDDYGIQTATPEHGIDAIQLIGTQIRRLIGADMNSNNDPNFKIKYGNKEFTKEEWFNYFNSINTANIIEAFKEIDEKFSDVREVEKLLQSEIRNNPRYGTELIKYFTLDENGNFSIPLDEPTQAMLIQQLLNSIIKNRVTKQKIKGGALIQATSYGMTNPPEIVYEGEGPNKKIKYVECYIPCPSEELYDLLLNPETHEIDINKKDENGNYILPEKYREVIGYRVPTEAKYSMVPLRVKGFLPRQLGSVIILPEEITSIAGSDYDVDKLYVMFHSLSISYYDISNAKKDFEKVNTGNRELIEALTGTNYDIEDNEVFKEWFESNKSMYKRTTPKVSVINYDFNKHKGNSKKDIYENSKLNSKEQRDSLILDLIRAALTSSEATIQFLNPGGFDEQKRASRIVSLLSSLSMDEVNSLGGINKILNMTLDTLDELLDKYKPVLNPLTPNTWVSFHNRNMAGAALIGIAANHNASHAIMQNTNLQVSDDYVFNIAGFSYKKLNGIKNKEGKFITRNIAGFLAAFVDNAKDPIAGDMNFNMLTADTAFTLLRLGYSPVVTALILKQPIVVEMVTVANNENISFSDAIEKVINKYYNYSGSENMPSYDKINTHPFTIEELASNIAAKKNAGLHTSNPEEGYFYTNQCKVGYLFAKLNKLATALGDLTQATRADTQNGAAGPTISDNIIKLERVEDILNNIEADPFYPLENIDFINFDMDEDSIIESPLPILQAFFTYGIEKTQDLFSKYLPYYNKNYRRIINGIKSMTRYDRLNVKTRNMIYNDFLSYYLSQYKLFGIDDNFSSMKEKRDYYINKFPLVFDDFKKRNPAASALGLVNRIKKIGYTKYNPAPSLIFTNVGGSLTPIQKEQYIKDWETLYAIEGESREMAIGLFIYDFFKGFGFSPSGFVHLTPYIIKKINSDYINGLNNVYKDIPIDLKSFERQFMLNHPELIQDVTNSSIDLDDDTNSFEITLDKLSSVEDKQFSKPFKEDCNIEFLQFVKFFDKGKERIFYKTEEGPNDNTAIYKEIKRLGLKNQYVEYEYGVDIINVESIIPEPVERNIASKFTFFEDVDISESDINKYKAEHSEESFNSLLSQVLEITQGNKQNRLDGLKRFEISDNAINFENLPNNTTDLGTGEAFCNYKKE